MKRIASLHTTSLRNLDACAEAARAAKDLPFFLRPPAPPQGVPPAPSWPLPLPIPAPRARGQLSPAPSGSDAHAPLPAHAQCHADASLQPRAFGVPPPLLPLHLGPS